MPGAKIIGKRTRKILDDLAERMIPSGGMDYPGARDIGLVDKLLELTGKSRMRFLAIKVLAWMWEISPLLLFRFKLLTSMTPQEQTAYFASWENSRLMARRWALLGLKAIFMAVFYNEPVVLEKIGFTPGKCFEQFKGEN